MPDTGALADYVTSDEMDLHLKEVIAKAKDGETRFVHFGFHQESAAQFVKRIAKSQAKWEGNKQIKFMTLEQAAKEYRRQNGQNGEGENANKTPFPFSSFGWLTWTSQ